jgi:hypothetical protein
MMSHFQVSAGGRNSGSEGPSNRDPALNKWHWNIGLLIPIRLLYKALSCWPQAERIRRLPGGEWLHAAPAAPRKDPPGALPFSETFARPSTALKLAL